MSKWAQKRKRNILIVFGIILLFIIALLFRSTTHKAPTCFDGIKNGKETGVDCGGGCTKVCREETRNIVVWWERPFKVSNGVYNLVAYIENQNLDSGIEKVKYEFRVYDKNNILISKPRVGITFVEANKRSAIFEPGVTTGDSEAYTVFFKFSPLQNWQKTNQAFSYNLFDIGDPVLSQQESNPKLKVIIKNTSIYNFRDIPVIAILYNKKGNAIASSRTYIDSINNGESKEVFYSWPEAFQESISRVEIIPRVNPFVSLDTITQ